MGFSTTSWHAARRVWTLEIDGRQWVARPVSLPDVITYQTKLLTATAAEGWELTAALLRLAFPWRPSFWWRGDPVAAFRQLARDYPDAARQAMVDFFPCLTGTPNLRAPVTDGTISPMPT